MLQWVGLLAGAAVWAAAHVVGYGVTEASCNSGGGELGDPLRPLAGARDGPRRGARARRGRRGAGRDRADARSSYEDAPPLGRIRFFALAALVANVIFTVACSSTRSASIFNVACRQG